MCLQLNAKHFEPRLHPRNKLYIERECSKLEKLILKELKVYSAEVADLVKQSAEVNVQVVKDLNEFVEGLIKFTTEREMELEKRINELGRELQAMTDSTGIKMAENTRIIQDLLGK